MFNNAYNLSVIGSSLDDPVPRPRPKPRKRVSSEPCLPERLPSTGFIQREAEADGPKALLAQLRRRSLSPTLSEEEEAPPTPPPKPTRRASSSSASSSPSSPKVVKKLPTQNLSGPWREPQAYEVFRAIERKDVVFLMEIRDRAFHLLLRKTGDATPLLHAMRVGASHRDVAIILLGAFSRWVNHLEDEEVTKPKTKALLKALRTNLKLAIDYGLAKSQSDLIASFLQTLVMSEGDKWIWNQTHTVSLALRSGTEGRPVATAIAAVRKFATKELGKSELIASLEDYIANATADLLMFGAWSLCLEFVQTEQIPSYYFARDDRVYKAFIDRVEQYKDVIQRKGSKRLKWQIRVLKVALDGRNTTYNNKVEVLRGELDEGSGV